MSLQKGTSKYRLSWSLWNDKPLYPDGRYDLACSAHVEGKWAYDLAALLKKAGIKNVKLESIRMVRKEVEF